MNEITTSTTTSTTSSRLPAPAGGTRHHRTRRAALGMVATAALVAAGTGIAGAAVVDPEADGHLVVVDECVEGVGPRLTLVYTNAAGPGVANFETTVDGEATQDVSVLPGGQEIVHVPVEEGSTPTVVVSANGGYSETITKGVINCWQIPMNIWFECTAMGPMVFSIGTNAGSLTDTVEILVDGAPYASHSLLPGEDFDYMVPVAEDASYHVRIVPEHSGWVSVDGYADCAEPSGEPDPDPEQVPDLGEDPTTPAPTTPPAPTTTAPPAQVESVTLVAAPVAVAPHFTG